MTQENQSLIPCLATGVEGKCASLGVIIYHQNSYASKSTGGASFAGLLQL